MKGESNAGFFDDLEEDFVSKRKTKRDNPRAQKKHEGGRSLLDLVVIAFALVLLGVMIVDAFQDYKRHTLLLQEGVLTTGVVTEKDFRRTSGLTTKGGGNSKYRVTYQYTALVNGSPTPFETRKSVSSFDYPKFSVGAEIEVLPSIFPGGFSAENGPGTAIHFRYSIFCGNRCLPGISWFERDVQVA
ncbi:MAG: hypothetical protein ACOYYJ_13655 [Chloroflexota bacterium]